MQYDLEPVLVKQSPILVRVQAGMEERLTFVGADGFPSARPAREHQSSVGLCLPLEDWKHAALIMLGEMKEAVPGDDPVEAGAQVQRSHVSDDPDVMWEAVATRGNHRW
jgi:hypothetical protein